MAIKREKDMKKLRSGFTTGACAAAAAKAALILLNGGKPGATLDVIFPDGKKRGLPLESAKLGKNGIIATAAVRKDAGDDPDVTDKALISVKISPISQIDVCSKDFTEKILGSTFVIRGGKGVGLATRKGLPIPEGKWAINPVPRKMISENIASCGYTRKGVFLLEISVKDGIKIARRTLNPTLGIVGGISILGTSGIVVPYSNKAYLDTVKILLDGARMQRLPHVALCTGGSTAKAVAKLHPRIPEHGIIRIGDFIGPTLKHAASLGFKTITVACMPGKLLKFAEGHRNTHAHNVKQQFDGLAKFAEKLCVGDRTVAGIRNSATVGEILELLDSKTASAILEGLAEKALRNFIKWTGTDHVEIIVFDSHGYVITRKSCS